MQLTCIENFCSCWKKIKRFFEGAQKCWEEQEKYITIKGIKVHILFYKKVVINSIRNIKPIISVKIKKRELIPFLYISRLLG